METHEIIHLDQLKCFLTFNLGYSLILALLYAIRIPYRITLLELDLDPLTEWREHLSEDYLLVPDRVVAVPLDTGAALALQGEFSFILSLYSVLS